jgi:hypothetical protein
MGIDIPALRVAFLNCLSYPTALLEQMIERVKWLDEQIEEYRRG